MKSAKLSFRAVVGIAAVALAPSAWALDDIPTQSGLSGAVNIAGAYTDADTNLVKGSQLWEIGDRRVNNVFQNPKSESDQFIAPGVKLAYTFGGPQIQLFLESDVEEIVTLETLQQAGVRKQFDNLGIMSLGFVTSGALPQEVWQDPYDATQARRDTDREFTGARFVWDRIIGLPVEVMLQYRDIEIDSERSGLLGGLGLTPAEASTLSREGDDYRAEVRYRWRKSKQEVFSPFIGYTNEDLDGDAIKNEGFYVGLDAGFQSRTWGLAGRIKGGSRYADSGNVIYGGRDNDVDFYEIALRGNVKLPWGDNWYGIGTIAYAEDNSKIDFYDQTNLVILAGAQWRFGQNK